MMAPVPNPDDATNRSLCGLLGPAGLDAAAVRLTFRQPFSEIFADGPCDPGNPPAACRLGGQADSNRSLRHDPNLADRHEQVVDGNALSRMIRCRRIAEL
jgi:hypothetical protein